MKKKMVSVKFLVENRVIDRARLAANEQKRKKNTKYKRGKVGTCLGDKIAGTRVKRAKTRYNRDALCIECSE